VFLREWRGSDMQARAWPVLAGHYLEWRPAEVERHTARTPACMCEVTKNRRERRLAGLPV